MVLGRSSNTRMVCRGFSRLGLVAFAGLPNPSCGLGLLVAGTVASLRILYMCSWASWACLICESRLVYVL